MKAKRILAAFLAAATCLSAMSVTAFAAKEKEFETAHEAAANMHAGINIGNTLSSIAADYEPVDYFTGDGVNRCWDENHQGPDPEAYETAWGNPVITKEYIAAIKNAGFDSVRLDVTWGNHADENGKINEPWMDRVQEVADMILEQDMYCIIDMHHDEWFKPTKTSYAEYSKLFTKVVKQIAVRFKDYDEKLMLEAGNETAVKLEEKDGKLVDTLRAGGDGVTEYFGWQPEGADYIEWNNKWMQLFVDTVRKTGGSNRWRNLVIPTFGASIGTGPNGDAQNTPEVFDEFKLPKDEYEGHLIIDIHYYLPTSFCFPDHQVDPKYATSEWGSEYDIWKLENDFAYINTLQEKTGAPIIIGEWGTVYKNNDDEVVEYIEAYLNQANKYGMTAFWFDPINTLDGGIFIRWWDFSTYKDQDFGIFNRSNGKVGWTEAADAYILHSYQGKLPAPKLNGTKMGNSVTLAWNDLSGAYGYRVYEYDAASKKYKQVAFISKNKKTIKNLTPGTHKFKVVPVARYKGGNKNGSASNAFKVKVVK